ncbi:MAG: hypothetical protein IKS85_06700 [Lachnospiraceae bacterium]|nr:hypothetical protein [Lachnospiraceae bacterium]
MSAKTKIIVLRVKELIMAGSLAALGLALILLLIFLILPGKKVRENADQIPEPAPSYQPGVYRSHLRLGDQTIDVETILEADRISSIQLVSLDEAITTAYPLLKPTMESICAQVCETQSLEDVKIESSARYTSLALLSAIERCIEKGRNALNGDPAPMQ